jgi:Fe-S-cluster containining protein
MFGRGTTFLSSHERDDPGRMCPFSRQTAGGSMNDILDQYGDLLQEVDLWFEACLTRHSESIACHRGCSECCRGLFDITLLDALYLKRGFEKLPEFVQQAVQIKSAGRLKELSEHWPDFTRPWTLNHIPEDYWDKMMPEEDDTPCPLLSDQGTCLVYGYRPMTCRLNGVPLIDTSGEELFDEWCSLNFTGTDPVKLLDIRHTFNDLFRQELLLFRELIRRICGKASNELDTIIPAAVFLDEDSIRMVRVPDNIET